MGRRLSISGKGQHVGPLVSRAHLTQFGLESSGNGLARRASQGRHMVFVEPAFTVDAVEITHLSVSRHEVDAQRNAQSAAVNRAKNGRRINDSAHTVGKVSELIRYAFIYKMIRIN